MAACGLFGLCVQNVRHQVRSGVSRSGLVGIEDDVRIEDSALDVAIAARGDCLETCYSYGVRVCSGWFLSPSNAARFWSWR